MAASDIQRGTFQKKNYAKLTPIWFKESDIFWVIFQVISYKKIVNDIPNRIKKLIEAKGAHIEF